MKTIDRELTTAGLKIRETSQQLDVPTWKPSGRPLVSRRLAMAGSGILVLIIAIGGLTLWRQGTAQIDNEVGAVREPEGFGTWQIIPEAPIEPRPHAVAAWTGAEVLFWAGSNLDRSFAYTDGATYNPVTNSWHPMTVPGWGHPGLTGVFFDGELYALAKGSGSRLDPSTGIWTDLPHVEGMYLIASVATDEAVWGLGPASLNPEGQPDVAIARFDPKGDRWIYGPVFKSPSEVGVVFDSYMPFDQPALWTGSEIVLWLSSRGGVAFDPSDETWRLIPAPVPPDGVLMASKAAVTDQGLVIVADIANAGQPGVSIATYDGESWIWRELGVPVDDLAVTTVAAASDWVVLFPAERAPITIHVPSGAWEQHDGGPLGGVEAPNVVWAGDRLVVWGGVSWPTEGNLDPASGAVWIPPGS